jgi:hypothetical protein
VSLSEAQHWHRWVAVGRRDELAQQPRRDIGKTIRIGLARMTTNKGIVWHNGLTDGYKELSRSYGRSAAGCPVNGIHKSWSCRERVLISPSWLQRN